MDTGADDAKRRDEADPLAAVGDRFSVPEGELYMDGNSLGVFSADAERALSNAVEEWKELGIRGWTDADPDWFHYGERLGDRLAPLVGADESEVVVGNSTTVNIHALFSTFYDGGDVVVNELDFPTDHYAIRAQMRNVGIDPEEHLVVVESRDGRTIEEDDVIDALSDETVDSVHAVRPLPERAVVRPEATHGGRTRPRSVSRVRPRPFHRRGPTSTLRVGGGLRRLV